MTNSRDESPGRTPRVWVAPSVFEKRRGVDGKRYHTTPTCDYVDDDHRELDLDELGWGYSECKLCAGEIESPDGQRTPLRDKVARGEISTATPSKQWWEI